MMLLSENKKSKVLFFLMGLFVFSNIYKLALSSVFGIGLALPEILLIPFVIALRKEIKLRVNIYLFFFTIGFWLFLYYLGTTQLGSGSLFTHSRGFLYIFLCFIPAFYCTVFICCPSHLREASARYVLHVPHTP